MRYVPRPGFRRHAERDPGVVDAMMAAAEQGRAFAQMIAPVDTGRYRDSLEVVRTDDGARLQSDVPYAAAVERRAHVLSRAVDVIERPL